MKLYFAPLACSLACRIAAYKANISLEYIQVDRIKKTLEDGTDYFDINPLGTVPFLVDDDGRSLTEMSAVLLKLSETWRNTNDKREETEIIRWLSFVGSELHKGLFMPFFDPLASDDVKEYTLAKGKTRLSFVNDALADREFLCGNLSVADLYLYVITVWEKATPISFDAYPKLREFRDRMKDIPEVKRAFAEEYTLYQNRS